MKHFEIDRVRKQVGASLAAALLLAAAGCAGGGNGTDGTDHAASAQAAMEAVAGKLPVSKVELQQNDRDFTLSLGEGHARLPATAGEPIHIDFGGGVTREVRILGATVATAQALQFSANTVIYAGTDRSASTAATVAVTEDGLVVETHTIVHDEAAPETYRMTISLLPGERLEAENDQFIKIVDESGYPQATIEAPWAQDAVGRAVPYSLSIDGNQIVMTVLHRGGGFTYPIVADPAIKVLCGGFLHAFCSIWFSRQQTRSMVARGSVLAALGALCGHLPGWAQAACHALTGIAGAVAAKAHQCASKNQCLRVEITPVPGLLYCVGKSPCWTK
ncbi:MAG: hypothetical protein ACXVDD_21590 [Polyangia bacterium]